MVDKGPKIECKTKGEGFLVVALKWELGGTEAPNASTEIN